jgi:hypothetical protein
MGDTEKNTGRGRPVNPQTGRSALQAEVNPGLGTVRIRMKRGNQVQPCDGPMRLAEEGEVVAVAPHEGRHMVLLGHAEIVEEAPRTKDEGEDELK